MLQWCGVRNSVGHVGQTYFLRLYCVTDTFFSSSLLQHPLATVGILEHCRHLFFFMFMEKYCVAYFVFSD
jgi:hypothetical protein